MFKIWANFWNCFCPSTSGSYYVSDSVTSSFHYCCWGFFFGGGGNFEMWFSSGTWNLAFCEVYLYIYWNISLVILKCFNLIVIDNVTYIFKISVKPEEMSIKYFSMCELHNLREFHLFQSISNLCNRHYKFRCWLWVFLKIQH